MNEEKKVTLIGDDGQVMVLTVVATLKINDTEYAILNDPIEDEDYIFTVIQDADGERFEIIDNEEEVQEVIEAYYEL